MAEDKFTEKKLRIPPEEGTFADPFGGDMNPVIRGPSSRGSGRSFLPPNVSKAFDAQLKKHLDGLDDVGLREFYFKAIRPALISAPSEQVDGMIRFGAEAPRKNLFNFLFKNIWLEAKTKGA